MKRGIALLLALLLLSGLLAGCGGKETAKDGERPSPGTVEDRRYSQPYFDLSLYLDESWHISSREEINEENHGGVDYSMEELFQEGYLYEDLSLRRDRDALEITLERAPLVTWNDEECYDLETYMEKEAVAMPAVMENEYGWGDLSVERFQTEICGVSYEVLSVTGTCYGRKLNQAFFCAERNGYYLVINLLATDKSARGVLAELLAEPGGN